ncbi:MAG TPA: RMD1 family protein [Novimethylophilus sp.]|uniref:RMD1 family protein n=1 Tax=Novimethylophilus sp. TaxID=2137426 RepID=UPI002F4111EC
MELQLKTRQDLKARALLLGDRLDLRAFKIADCLATTPLTLEVDVEGGVAVLFRYGVVVLFGVKSLDEVRFIETLKPLITNPYTAPEIEELEIHCGKPSLGVQSGAVSLDEISLEKVQVIADALSKNLVLSLYEKKVAGEFDKIEPLAQQLATHGKVSADSKTLLSKIGHMLLIEHRMVGRAEIGDKPEILWDFPHLGGLYASLEDEFELQERQAALDRKLGLISDTAQTLADVWDNKQLHKLEWYVIGLILFEIVISLFELSDKFLR